VSVAVHRKAKKPASARQFGGVPAPAMRCEEGLRELVALIERGAGVDYAELKRKWAKAAAQERKQIEKQVDQLDRSYSYFCDFLGLLDKCLSGLIEWTEQASPSVLKEWAGKALAERLLYLYSQKGFWERKNDSFAEAWPRDRRKARAPESCFAWKAREYVRRINYERDKAQLWLTLRQRKKGNEASALDCLYSAQEKKRLKKIAQLKDFGPDSAREWADMVYQEMLKDEEKIMSAPELQGKSSYESRRRAELAEVKRRKQSEPGKARLADYRRTIKSAVLALAKKARGQVLGITRP